MKINRIYEIEEGVYGDSEITLAFITGDLTVEKIKDIIEKTSLAKDWRENSDLYTCDMVSKECEKLMENKSDYFKLESAESDLFLG